MNAAIAKLTDRFTETEIDDEIVVMQLDTGDFFSLTGTSTAIWRLIDGSRDRQALVAKLCAEFGAAEAEVAADVDELLGKLRGAGLLGPG